MLKIRFEWVKTSALKPSELSPSWRYPAEWEPHKAVWLAWPWHRELWEDNLPNAQKEFKELVILISQTETVKLMGYNEEAILEAKHHLGHLSNIEYFILPYGDIWLRDTGSLFFVSNNKLCAKTFEFNGWGEKYLFEEDPLIAKQMAVYAQATAIQSSSWIVEGGALEWDGQGTLLTTRECLQNPNRKNELSTNEKALESFIMSELGVQKVCWISKGLINDHTDGHIDTIARFVAPGVVVCMESLRSDDPQKDRLKAILDDIKQLRDANGSKLEIFTVPSPGNVRDEDGHVMPASYMNFYIANDQVVVPTYESSQDDLALKALEPLFKNRRLFGSPSKAILSGGGSFHCITQQEPKT